MRRGLAYLLFLLSGATALCYEIAWTRHLVLVFGSTTRAVALILAAYMLGLALGSEAGGRLADRVRRPALLYALAEGLIGLYAFIFPWLVAGVRGAYLTLGTAASPVLFGGAFALLLVPTTLMGATLPLLVRAGVEKPEATGATVGRLYGVNIVGAVLGAATTGFWLMEAAGVTGATFWAAGVNFAIAIAGLLAFRGVRPAQDADVRSAEPERAGSSRTMRAALVSVFSAGLVGLAAEVLWTRLLTFTLNGFTYTFSAMLATFLLGLALGGFAFGRIASRTTDPVAVLARLHAAIGVLAAGVLLALTYHQPIAEAMWTAAGSVVGRGGDLRVRHVVQLLLSSAIVLLPPAFLMGGIFPVAAAAYRRGLGDLGARVGRLYAVNTVGAVLGSLIAGFVLAPLVGLTWGAAAVPALSIAAAVAVAALGPGVAFARWRAPLVGTAFVAALLLLAHPDVPFILHSHVFAGEKSRENRLVASVPGAVCQVSVVENERERYRLLYTDEFEAAGTKPEYRYMRLLAHLPVALAQDPSRVLVICFGTGTTAGSVSTHDCVKRLDVVEISPQVLEVADRFRDVNRDALHGAGRTDLDVAVHVDDGRNFVLRSKEQWGVITLEPLMPYTPAAIHLYTEDFYRECAPRLAPGGVMCQWIPLHAMREEHFKQLVAAFVTVFPDSALFFVDGAVALIGGNAPGPFGTGEFSLPYARVLRRLSEPAAKEDLAAAGFDDPIRALANFVTGGNALRLFTFGFAPVTDEHPVLEFHPLPIRTMVTHLWANSQAMKGLRDAWPRLPLDDTTDDVVVRADDAFRSAKQQLQGFVAREANAFLAMDRSRDPADALAALEESRQSFQDAVVSDPKNVTALKSLESGNRALAMAFGEEALRRNDFTAAEEHFRRALRFRAMRQADVAWTRLAEVLSRGREDFEGALAAATEATRLYPRGFDALCERAYARAALGDVSGAREDYLRALEGEDVATITSPRILHDAERVLREPPGAAPSTIDARIAKALSGEGWARVPASSALSILAADEPQAYAAYFRSDLDVAMTPYRSADERVAALERLRRARPPGTAEVAARVLAESGLSLPLADAAAETLLRADPARLQSLLAPATPTIALAAAARAAGRTRDPRFVDALRGLLVHEDARVRSAAHVSAFSLVGDRYPPLGRLDPSAWPSRGYLDAVEDFRAFWARERDRLDSSH